jgi:hypothetical protein
MRARPHKNISFTWDETYTLPETSTSPISVEQALATASSLSVFSRTTPTSVPSPEQKHPSRPARLQPRQRPLLRHAGLLTDGSQKHLTAAKNGFAFVLAQSYATGGWGANEGFVKPETDRSGLHSPNRDGLCVLPRRIV